MKNKLASFEELKILMGKRIADLRANKLGVTQSQFSILMGVHQVTIASWETGHQIPTRVHLDKMCALFGVDRFELERTESI